MKIMALTKGKTAKVDDADFKYLSRWKWSAYESHGTWYAVRADKKGGRQRRILMHRVVIGAGKDLVVDHINHDGLDNRRANLRPCSKSENQHNRIRVNKNNTSGIRGVSYVKRTDKWVAYIYVEGKRIPLGYHKEKQAAAAIVAAKRLELGLYSHASV